MNIHIRPPASSKEVEVRRAGAQERREFCGSGYAQIDNATVKRARQALQQRFGMTIATEAITSILRAVRPDRPGRCQIRCAPSIDRLVREMRSMGVRAIEVNGAVAVVVMELSMPPREV